MQSIIGQLQDEVGQLQGELRQSRDELGQLQGEVGQSRDEIGRLQGEVGLSRGEIGQLQGEIGQSRDEVGQVRNEQGRFMDGMEAQLSQFLNALTTVRALSFRLNEVATESSRAAVAGEKLQESLSQVLGESNRVAAVADTLQDSLSALDRRTNDLSTSQHQTWDRIEFVRREIMYEMMHGERDYRSREDRAALELPSAETRKRWAKGPIKLNIGCGHIAMDGYVNTDMRRLPGVDLVADADALPFEGDEVEEIYSAHLLEHFTQEHLSRRVLPHWFSILKPGGLFRAITPDGDAMVREAATDAYAWGEFREVLFGGQEYGGDFHYNLLSPESAMRLLREADFVDVEVPVRGRRNGLCFEFEITARKPAAVLDQTDETDDGNEHGTKDMGTKSLGVPSARAGV